MPDATPASLAHLHQQLAKLPADTSAQPIYLEARALQRQLALATPLLDFDALLFTKRVPGSYSHMSDQYYGWWSRPGGGIYILRGLTNKTPTTECLTEAAFKEPGSFLRPALSFDGTKVVFAWCKHYPELAKEKDKLNKANVPEDAFYHIFEMNPTAQRAPAHARQYDDFDARYLWATGISVHRRGQAIRSAKAQATVAKTICRTATLWRDASRPVAVYAAPWIRTAATSTHFAIRDVWGWCGAALSCIRAIMWTGQHAAIACRRSIRANARRLWQLHRHTRQARDSVRTNHFHRSPFEP
jgi:hypothetical protein